MSTWFSSDYHLGHVNVLKFDKRPYKTIEEHDEDILTRQGALVKPKDTFYFLGDFALCDIGKAEEYMKRLKGVLHFIKGNHDHRDMRKLYQKYGEYHGMMDEVLVEGEKITLNHYPMRTWNRSHHGSFLLHGHEHGGADEWGKSLDCAVNVWEFNPLPYETIKEILTKRSIVYAGHHNPVTAKRKNGVL